MPESRSFLTVDIGGTKTAVAVGFADARIADRVEFGT
ncbi:MAG: ROK family protein, partial [Phycisphaerae bacterium]|nr:ROK family protein [Phycisphaerae bacterium]